MTDEHERYGIQRAPYRTLHGAGSLAFATKATLSICYIISLARYSRGLKLFLREVSRLHFDLGDWTAPSAGGEMSCRSYTAR